MSRLHCIQTAKPVRTVLLLDDELDIRVEKILDIRRQLDEGRYSTENRLDVVIDRILEDYSREGISRPALRKPKRCPSSDGYRI